MNKKVVRLGVIGTGPAALTHLAAFQAISGARVVALAGGRDSRKMRNLAKRFGVKRCLPSAEELIDFPGVEAVVIALPPFMQRDLAVRALENGKHVLCEKPLAVTLDDARVIYKAWKKSRRVGAVNFCYRLIPQIQEFKQRLAAGDCGKIHSISAEWILSNRLNPALTLHWKGQRELGGGVLQNYGIHVLDYLFYDHPDVKLLGAKQDTFIPQRRDSGGHKHTCAGDEVTTAFFDLGKGTVGYIHLSLVTVPALGHCLTARGDKGTMKVCNLNPKFPAGPFSLWFFDKSIKRGKLLSAGSGERAKSKISLFRRVAQRFAAAVLSGQDRDLPTIEDGLNAGKILGEIQNAAGTVSSARKVC